MKKNDIIMKLTSRKLWVTIAGIACGVAIALGANASEIESIAGAVTAIITAITYIYTEGKIDAARISTAIDSTQKAIEILNKSAE